jgi:hypothetical protein
MPTHDFATVTVFEGPDHVDAAFLPGLGPVGLLKSWKARFDGTRKTWHAPSSRSRLSPPDMVEAIREELIADGPEGWAQALSKISRFACATKGFELKVGPGGMRIAVPPGHPLEYALRDMADVKPDIGRWHVPAKACMRPEMRPVLERIVREDKEKFMEAARLVEGRRLSGPLRLAAGERGELGLDKGVVAWGNPSFMKAIDPYGVKMPSAETPARVTTAPDDAGLTALELLKAEESYLAVKARVNAGAGAPPRALDSSHVGGKWSARKG